jgi:hypothetical protein
MSCLRKHIKLDFKITQSIHVSCYYINLLNTYGFMYQLNVHLKLNVLFLLNQYSKRKKENVLKKEFKSQLENSIFLHNSCIRTYCNQGGKKQNA